MRTNHITTTEDALRINESMTKLVDSTGIKDPELRKILIDTFNEEAANGMGCGLSVNQIIAENDRRITEWPSQMISPEVFEAAVREEAEARGLI